MQMMDSQDTDEDQQFWNSELFRAVEYGRKRSNITEEKILDKVKECLCEGADIDAINLNSAGNTVLHVAVKHRYKKVIEFLLGSGARPDVVNSQGLTSITLAQKLNCEKEIIDLLCNYDKLLITNKLSISYWSKNQPIWNNFKNNFEIAVLEVNSVELSPDFLQQVEFYDAIDTAGNLFFVDVMLSHMDNIDEDFIKSQLQRINKQLIIQCCSNFETKVCCKGSKGVVKVINLNSPVENYDEDMLTVKLCRKESFWFGLIVESVMLNLVGIFESEQKSLLKIRFDLEKHFKGLKLIDYAIKYGDVITVRLLSLSNWNLIKLNALRTCTLGLAAEYGNVDKLAAVLRIKFPIQLDNNICIPEEMATYFDKCKKQMFETAVIAGNCDVISFLIRCGVQLDADVIELAWDNKRYDVVFLLLKADCVFPYDFDLNLIDENEVSLNELKEFVDERDCLHGLIEKGDLNSVKLCVKSMAPSRLYLDKDNKSAVYRALKSNNFNIFVWLKSELKAEFRHEYERTGLGVGVLDSATDALVPLFVPVENAHILHLVAKSRSHQQYKGFKEHIESIYAKLNSIQQVSTVLKVIQFCDQIDIIYDFDKDSIVDVNIASSECDRGFCEYEAGRIYIGAKGDPANNRELLGTIAHELTHLAMQTIYGNDCKPYKLGDSVIDDFDKIIEEIRSQSISVNSIIRRVFLCYRKDAWPSELIVRVNQMLATYGSEDGLGRLELQAKPLLQFYQDHVTPCCEAFISESHQIKLRNIIKALNDCAGITSKFDESKIRLKKSINLDEVFCESEVQVAVVTSTSPLLSTMSVYQTLKEISKQPNSFLIMNFDGYVKRRRDINRAFYSDVCKFLFLLCESDPEKSALRESLKRLATVLWAKSDKKVIFVMENGELLKEEINQRNLDLPLLVHSDIEYTLDDLSVESAKLLLDQSVSLQCRDANIKLSSWIDEEHYKLVDAQTLLKLINKQPIVIGKEINTSKTYDKHFYIDREFSRQAVIKEDILKDENRFTMYAISDTDETTLTSIFENKDVVSKYELLNQDPYVKYVILDNINGAEQYQHLCRDFPRHNVHWLKKVDGGFHWLKSRYDEHEVTHQQKLADAQPFIKYRENELADQVDEHRVIVVSDTAGMGKSTVLNSLSHQIKKRYPLLWVIRVNLNDYTKLLDEEQKQQSFESDRLIEPFKFFVDRLLESRVESRLETKFENLLLHFLQHNKDRVVIMFDGFDEIKWSHQSLIKDVLVALKSSKVKQLWVTTRPHMRETLESTLHHLSYTLQPLDETDQVNFLTRFWRHGLKLKVEPVVESGCNLDLLPDKLHCFAEALIELFSKSISDREKFFTGVPLQLMMVAECFGETATEFYYSDQCKPDFSSKIQMSNLFRMFFERKFLIFQSEKNRIDFSKPNMESQSDVQKHYFLHSHQIASLFANFDDGECELLLHREELSRGVSFISDIASNKWNTGIIDLIIDGKPHFVHLTFAEYLTAEFIVSLLAKGQQTTEVLDLIFAKVLYEDKFKVVRGFVDIHMCETSLSDAVLDQYGKTMRHLWVEQLHGEYEHIHLTDGEENFLHVAAKEGNANITDFVLKCFGICEIRADLIKCVDGNGMQSLHVAAQNGHLDVVKVLIHHGANLNARVNNGDRYGGFSALLLAAYCGHVDICEWLINNGANINATVSGYEVDNVVQLAAKGGRLDVLKMLRNIKEIDFEALLKVKSSFDGLNALHIAAFNRDWEAVKWIISEGLIDVNNTVPCFNHHGKTVLMWAIESGPFKVVQWLIDNKADINIGSSINNNTALHLAVLRNGLRLIRMLVSIGANVNAVNRDGQTPLHLAAKYGFEQVVKFLVNIGDIDVNYGDWGGLKPLHLAASTNKVEVVKILVSNRAIVNAVNSDGWTPLHLAAAKGSELVVVTLLEMTEVDLNVTDNQLHTPLHRAVMEDQLHAVRILVSRGANINCLDYLGNTPLHCAALHGRDLVVEFLLKTKDIDVNLTNINGLTPMHLAAMEDKSNVVKLLIENGHGNVIYSNGMTLLHIAAASGSELVVEFLLKTQDIEVNITSEDGSTPLHLSAFNNELNVAKILVENGANVNAVNSDGHTPLHRAAAQGCESTTKFLLNIKDVDVNITDKNGLTPLHEAAIYNRSNVAKLLVSCGADVKAVSSDGWTPLHYAAAYGFEYVVECLSKVKDVDVNVSDKNGSTPLHLAAYHNRLDVAKILVSSGANVNAVRCGGHTPLHLAAAFGSELVVEFLLKIEDVDVNVADEGGATSLHLAADENHLKVVVLLVRTGANVNAVDHDGQTPLHYAAAGGSDLVVKYLLTINDVDVSIVDKKDRTPLSMASMFGNQSTVDILFQ